LKAIRQGKIELDAASKVQETADELIVPVMLDRESILTYIQGKGYRPAKELEAAKKTLNDALIIAYEHTETPEIRDPSIIRGKVRNAVWNTETHGFTGELHFFKDTCDEEFLNRVREGTLNKDVSSAYYCNEVYVPGEFGGEKYDFYQEQLVFHHVAVGVPEGRCPPPYCGLMDSFDDFLRVKVREPEVFSSRMSTVLLSAKNGIYALAGKLRSGAGTFVREYMFDVNKGWTREKAEQWAKKQNDSDLDLPDTPPDEQAGGNHVAALADSALLDPEVVLAQSRKILSNMSPLGDRQNVMTGAGWSARHHDGAK